MHRFDDANSRKLPLSTRQLRSFWSLSIPLPVRDVWYRMLCHKLPTAKALSPIGRVPSETCRLCHNQVDSIPHFVVHCPLKWPIWVEVLSCFRPLLYFSPTQIFRLLRLEDAHPFATLDASLLQILAITHWRIWTAYWQHIIHSSPFDPLQIINDTISHCSIATKKHPLLS